MVEREKVKKTVLGNYHIYRCQDEETGTVVYEVVRRVGWKDLSDTIIFAPLALLIGFLFGLYPEPDALGCGAEGRHIRGISLHPFSEKDVKRLR